ncbi:immunoglobulin-like domain-containing protein [Helcococcus kunzii]|uniref:immunoglobulin-like domain-containing protein n=1 Tax=Helcococcus kunzii TaxID=40091 RepID=UPI0024AD1631|nr:immunoglobulin-like domain-containing protein [Helcococcus kunzii]
MKKTILLFSILIFVLLGCAKKERLTYEVEEIKNEFVDFKFIKDNNGDMIVEFINKQQEEVTTSSDNNFKIYKIENESELKEIDNPLDYKDISLIIRPQEGIKQKIRLSKLISNLSKGKYEIRKSFDYEEKTFESSLRFTIK